MYVYVCMYTYQYLYYIYIYIYTDFNLYMYIYLIEEDAPKVLPVREDIRLARQVGAARVHLRGREARVVTRQWLGRCFKK